MPPRDEHGPPKAERELFEQRLMRVGRRLQSIGQLLEQAPARIVAKGFPRDEAVTGARPVEIDLAELRALFEESAPENVGALLHEYQEVLAKARRESP